MSRTASTHLFMLVAGCWAVGAAQLPPEIMVDRHLVRIERLLAEESYGSAHEVMNEIIALRDEHGLTLEDEFHFRYAQVAFAMGLTQSAVEALNTYLVAAGRQGEFYRAALELLDSAEDALRRADAERRRAEAERQQAEAERRRAEALKRQQDELVRRQMEAASRPFPRDSMASGGLGPEMVAVAAGRFQFSYRNRYRAREFQWVELSRSFAISKYEVTREEFERFARAARYRTDAEDGGDCFSGFPLRRPSWRRPGFDQTDAHPVVCVSLRDAMAYAAWLSEETGQDYRLPNAIEWQYAARAGSGVAMLGSETASNSCGRANLHDNWAGDEECSDDGARYTAAVGRYPRNSIGLHDMIGNVWEWVVSCGRLSESGWWMYTMDGLLTVHDGCGDSAVFIMGGGFYHNGTWGSETSHDASAIEDLDTWAGGESHIGFRVVRDIQD